MLDVPPKEPPAGNEQVISARLDATFERGLEYAFFDDVLETLLFALASPSGAFVHLDEFGDLICASLRGALCSSEPSTVYKAREACQGPWAQALDDGKLEVRNAAHSALEDGPTLQRSVTVPIQVAGQVIGLLAAADRDSDYDAQDLSRSELIARRVAPFLLARDSQRRLRRQLADLESMAKAAAEGERFFMLSGDLLASTDDRIVRVNPAFSSRLGWEDHEVRGRSLPEFAHTDDRAMLARALTGMRAAPNRDHPPVVVRMVSKGGECHSIEWTGAATDEGRIYAVGRDLSELRSAIARLAAQNEQLQFMHDQVRREQALAGHLLANVRRHGCLDIPGVQHLNSPLDFFNGDVILAAASPAGELCWMLGDFTGHGLSAAVGTIPVASAFYATIRKGVPLAESIETINDVLKSLLPPGLFCAAAFLRLDPSAGKLTVWNAGLPGVIVRTTRDGSVRVLTSQALPLGLVTSRELEVEPVCVDVEATDEIYVYSDGLTEAADAAGELFGAERVAAALADPGEPGTGFHRLLAELSQHRGAVSAADDVSLVVVTVGAVRLPGAAVGRTALPA